MRNVAAFGGFWGGAEEGAVLGRRAHSPGKRVAVVAARAGTCIKTVLPVAKVELHLGKDAHQHQATTTLKGC